MVPGNSKSLWKAVTNSKNLNYESIPKEIYIGGISVDKNEMHETFADYFSSKITDLAVF